MTSRCGESINIRFTKSTDMKSHEALIKQQRLFSKMAFINYYGFKKNHGQITYWCCGESKKDSWLSHKSHKNTKRKNDKASSLSTGMQNHINDLRKTVKEIDASGKIHQQKLHTIKNN